MQVMIPNLGAFMIHLLGLVSDIALTLLSCFAFAGTTSHVSVGGAIAGVVVTRAVTDPLPVRPCRRTPSP